MPNYTFTARDGSGQWHNGTLAADSASDLAGTIRARGWSLVKAETANDAEEAAPGKSRFRRRGILPATSFDVEMGLRMLSIMLDGGLTLMSSLKTCADQARRPHMAAIWDDVHDRVASGMTFAAALSRHAVFPKLVVQLSKAGEISGTLDTVLDQAAEQLERKRNLMVTVFSAMMYPTVTTLVSFAVAAFLVIKVIPEISSSLIASGRRLPAVTQALISSSQFVNAYLPQIAIIIVASVLGLAIAYQFEPAAKVADRYMLKVPILGKLLRLSGTTIFSRGLSMLLEAGVPMIAALETAGSLMKNRALIGRVESARRSVLAGNSLTRPLAAGSEFLPMLHRMVAIGEETGTLGSVLNKVANFHEKQLESYIKRMTVLIEPVMTVVVGGMVGFVYIAFFMALYSVSG